MPGAAATAVVATSVIGGVFGMVQGEQQQKIMEQQAAQERAASQMEASDFRDRISRAQASSRAQQGRSGIMQNTGSPLMVSVDFAGEAAEEELKILQGGSIRAGRLQQSGKLAKSQGIGQFFGGVGRAGSALLNPTVQRRFGSTPRSGLSGRRAASSDPSN